MEYQGFNQRECRRSAEKRKILILGFSCVALYFFHRSAFQQPNIYIIPKINDYDILDRHLRNLIGSRHVVTGLEKSVTDCFAQIRQKWRYIYLLIFVFPIYQMLLPEVHTQIIFTRHKTLKRQNSTLQYSWLVGNKFYNNFFFVGYCTILFLGKTTTPSQDAGNVTDDIGLILFSDDCKKGYHRFQFFAFCKSNR